MRIAVVSDVHGNLTALEAVLADLDQVDPDLIVQGGDVALGGPHPVEVVDRIRELGWPGVLGNTDLLDEQTIQSKVPGFAADAARRTREMLGPERVQWLTQLPIEWRGEAIALIHAVPGDCWAIVPHDASDDKLREVYGPLEVPFTVYGHIHHAYIRELDGLTVVNTGSLSLALDGDVRATYVVIEDERVEHRRVPYDLERVANQMLEIDYPNAARYANWLRTGAWT